MDAETIKNHISITAHAKRLGVQFGKGRSAHCPNLAAHENGDKNASLVFSKTDKSFECKACGIYGSVIDLHGLVNNMDFKTSLADLERIYNLSEPAKTRKPSKKPTNRNNGDQPPGDEIPLPEAKTPSQTRNTKDFSGLYRALQEYCAGFDEKTISYLTGPSRGLSEASIKKYGIFEIRDYNAVSSWLKKTFKPEDLKDAGLLNEKENLIFYAHRIIIPYYNFDFKIELLRGRYWLNHSANAEKSGKYLSLTGRSIPQLFNIQTIKSINPGDRLYIVEGEFDAIIAEQNGDRAVGVAGMNNWNDEYAKQLKHYEIVVCLDNPKPNSAGQDKERINIQHSMDRIGKSFYDIEKPIKLCHLPLHYKDISEFYGTVPF